MTLIPQINLDKVLETFYAGDRQIWRQWLEKKSWYCYRHMVDLL